MNILTTTQAWTVATFTRASTALKLDGSQVASGQPRYEVAPFGRGIMIEEGDGTRADEVLTLPATLVPVAAGTLEVDILVDPLAGSNAAAAIVGESSGANTLRIHRNQTSSSWLFACGDAAGNTWVSPNVAVVAGWRRFALSWDVDAATLRGYVDGVLVVENLAVSLPATFAAASGSKLFLGRWWADNSYINSLLGWARISSRARSAAEISAGMGQPLTLDADTVALLTIPATGEALVVTPDESVQLDCPPIRPARKQTDQRQLRETDSDGNPVVYGKGDRISVYGLTFPRVSTVTLAALFSFVASTVQGVRRSFTWIDHSGTAHAGARLTSSRLRSTPAGPNRHRVELEIEVTE